MSLSSFAALLSHSSCRTLSVIRHVAGYDSLGLEIFDEVLQFNEAALTRITNPVVASTLALDWRFICSLGEIVIDHVVFSDAHRAHK